MTVTLKLATSLDGRIATASGESRWITGPQAREAVHRLRAEHDAVVVGIETALADDPELTVRLPDFQGTQPGRVILDSRQRLPLTSRLAATAREIPTYLISAGPPVPRLVEMGVRVLQVEASPGGHADLTDVLRALTAVGLSALFVEGGGQVAASFLCSGLVDRLEWFRAPMIIGAEGRAGVGSLALAELSAAPRLKRVDLRELGPDVWERYERI